MVSVQKQAESSLSSRTEQFEQVCAGLDPETAIQKLTQEKDKAVRDENFDLAQYIKGTITRLQSYDQQLKQLEHQKRFAVQNANQLKLQIYSL